MLSKPDLIRLTILGFFIGLNIILGAYFLMTVIGTGKLPTYLVDPLDRLAAILKIETKPVAELTLLPPFPDQTELEINNGEIISLVNQTRFEAEIASVSASIKLSAVAKILTEQLADELKLTARNFQSDIDLDQMLGNALETGGYDYKSVLQQTVTGPTTIDELEQYWIDNELFEVVTAQEVSQIGVSVKLIDQDNQKVGLIVILLAEPLATQAAQPSTAINDDLNSFDQELQPPTFPSISDQEVFTALNQYRADHNVHQLIENHLLCEYAEKRVQDLIAYGGLDDHQGFRADFADLEHLPEPIQQYPGGRIGENLAHQFCRNMTTGDSFVAETGTALIEWCFDSSTKGHREAQLDPTFNNVCIRHGEGMYVVIFGE